MRRALLAVLLVLAGCRFAGSGWPADQPGPRTITILSGTDVSAGDQQGVYQRLAASWGVRDGYSLRFEFVPGGATAVHSQMLADAQTGGRDVDIYNLDSQWISEFARGGYLRPLDDRVRRSDFLPAPWATGKDSGGRLYGIPFITDVGLLYYRTDVFSAQRIAALQGFDDVVKLAGKREYAGQFARYEGLTVNALDAIWSHDPDAFRADGTVRDRAAIAAGLRDLVAAVRTGAIPMSELDDTESEALHDFTAGTAVLMRNWPIYYGQIKNAKPVAGLDIAGKVGIAPLPFVSALGGQDLVVSRRGEAPHEALKVIEYLTSPESERCLFLAGGFVATRAGAYTGGLPADRRCGSAPLLPGDVRATLVRTLPGLLQTHKARPRPATRYYTEFSEVLQDGVRCLVTPGQTCSIGALIDRLDAAAAGKV